MVEEARKGNSTLKFPRYSLEEATLIAKAAYGPSGGVPTETIAHVVSESAKSSSFLQKLAAAKYFGLVQSEGKKIRTTEL